MVNSGPTWALHPCTLRRRWLSEPSAAARVPVPPGGSRDDPGYLHVEGRMGYAPRPGEGGSEAYRYAHGPARWEWEARPPRHGEVAYPYATHGHGHVESARAEARLGGSRRARAAAAVGKWLALQ
jgi:hypothetical protein